MGLRNLGFDNRSGRFDSDQENLLDSFYVPCLSNASLYRRVAGYFSSGAFALALPGIESFVKRNGKIQLIANVVLSEKDANDIKNALLQKEEEVLSEFVNLKDELERLNLSLLSYLIQRNVLELKIAVVPSAIAHAKWGLFVDSAGDVVLFSGSDNETAQGWRGNHERFEVHVSWIESDMMRFVQPAILDWQRYWSDKGTKIRIYPVSLAFSEGLIRIAPKNGDFENVVSQIELLSRLENHQDSSVTANNREPYAYQKEAIDSWFANQNRGVLKMATGTGKTFTAIKAVKRYLQENKSPHFVLVVAPTQVLVKQWARELQKEGLSNPVLVMQNQHRWRPELLGRIAKMELGRERHVVSVATYASYCGRTFTSIVQKLSLERILVADEMHHAWAPKFRTGLLDSYGVRLGLSATPEVYMDDEGTAQLLEYFGGVCYEFGMDKAIPRFLTEYDYYAELVYLDSDEIARYEDLSRKIAQALSIKKKVDDAVLRLMLKRAKIIVNASGKWAAFERLLDQLGVVRRTLIYCSDKQIDRVKKILHRRLIRAHQVTHEESLQYREEILDYLSRDRYQAVVAMKVLDEGIDVPGIECAIILASSGNPVEFIQRRGRVLRKSVGKSFSRIYDVIALPWESIPSKISAAEASVLKRELVRVEEFANLSRNPLEVTRKLLDYRSRLDVVIKDA